MNVNSVRNKFVLEVIMILSPNICVSKSAHYRAEQNF